ncbi:MAG: GNAT family N-acetyltransferase [bacterium]
MTETRSDARSDADRAADYPPQWEADVVVTDGGTVHLRPMTPSDSPAVVAFHGQLSERSRYLRYFSAYPRIPEKDLHRFTHVDHVDRVALVVWLGGEIIGIGRFDRLQDSTEAEVAFVIADAHQRRGIGSILLEHLAAAARERGITRFTAEVLAENARMLRVFVDAGYEARRSVEYNVVHLEFEIDETALTESVARQREQSAEAASIRRLLTPRSVAVIGASRDPSKIGNAVLRNLVRGDFAGSILPVHPSAAEVEGRPAYASVLDVPGPVDLAVIATPADSVGGVVAECAAKGVHGLVVISGGFGERSGDERAAGLAAQRALVASAREHGMRVVGPNCLGIANNDPAIRLNASLAPLVPPRGRTGFFSQSGALGVAVLGEAVRRDVGLSTFVSAGNRADVSGNDLLQYWAGDPDTDVVLLYLESFGNPRKFVRLSRRLGRTKPIVAVKSGRGGVAGGLRNTSVAMSEEAVGALFEASGIIRVDTLDVLFDVGLLLATQPLPAGLRVAVVGNSAALNVLVTSSCTAEGLEPVRAVDIGVNATAEQFAAAAGDAVAAEDVDALVAVFVPPLLQVDGARYAQALREAVRAAGKPVLTTFLGFDGVPGALAEEGELLPTRGSIPSYPSPERAVRTLARTARHAAWRRRDPGVVPAQAGTDLPAARRVAQHVLATTPGGRELGEDEVETVLGAVGLHLVPSRGVVGPWEARSAAVTLGWPVALRLPSGSGAETSVRLRLTDEHALADAWADLGLAEDGRAVVQAMAPRGVDTVFGVQDDPSFGALVSFGVGGVATRLLGDLAYAAAPLTDRDADELVRRPRAAPLLTGYAGGPVADLTALAEIALRLSLLADELPEIAQLRLGTVVASVDGAHILSAGIRVAPPPSRADGPRRIGGL